MEEQDKTLLSFQIEDEVFAVDAMKVDHILEVPSQITEVPNTPDYITGIINLHGNIITVADMRILTGQKNKEKGADTSIVVINPTGEQDSKIGLIVDMVKEVIETESSQFKETVLEGKKGLINSFEGTVVINKEFIHVIDLNSFNEIIEK
ncbi:chemotaxis protein CheW [Marinilabiliaceae bacterium ANBcel2]|nr:chemotaxis protein CheW [Marinilabiliaceae bacterium ANBcel2]